MLELEIHDEETHPATCPPIIEYLVPCSIRAGFDKPLARPRRQRSIIPWEWTTDEVDQDVKGCAFALNEVEGVREVAASQADYFGIPTIGRNDRSREGIGGPLHPRPTVPRKHRSVTMGDDGDGPAITPSADDGRTTTI